MPYFRPIRLLECDVVVRPYNNIRAFKLFSWVPYFSGRDVSFKVEIEDTSRQPISPISYSFDWQLLIYHDNLFHPIDEDEYHGQETYYRWDTENGKIGHYIVDIPFVTLNGKYEFAMKLYKNGESISDWKFPARFDVWERDKAVVIVLVGIINIIIGTAIGTLLARIFN